MDFSIKATTGALFLASVMLMGCSAPAPKNFGGRWKPVNQFRDQPSEIALAPTYVYYASPMDETLKMMLDRWSNDSGRSLAYRIPFDITLHKPVANVRTSDVLSAVEQLSSIYAPQDILVTVNTRQILVDRASKAANLMSEEIPTHHVGSANQPGKN